MTQYALFETALGWAGLAWDEAGLAAVRIPTPERDRAEAALKRRFPDAVAAAPTPAVAKVIDDVRGLLAGGRPDFADAPLDLARVPEFHAQVYAITRAIPPGETLTYGEIAVKLGDRLLARDVGAALGKNPWPIVVPCHRVTAAGGRPGGFSARGGVNTKLKLLGIEGAKAAAQADLFA